MILWLGGQKFFLNNLFPELGEGRLCATLLKLACRFHSEPVHKFFPSRLIAELSTALLRHSNINYRGVYYKQLFADEARFGLLKSKACGQKVDRYTNRFLWRTMHAIPIPMSIYPFW